MLNSRWIKRAFVEALVVLVLAIIGAVLLFPAFEALGSDHLEDRFGVVLAAFRAPALFAVRQEVALISDITNCLGELAEHFMKQKEYDAAARLYQTALEIPPKDLWTQVHRGALGRASSHELSQQSS